ncbi:DNA internalization-related competence protein ComEC/Rec2 [Caldicellulosiruptor naganoensis]|uniref:DNA internalization-related competence protein ComEC/Rec2 n=1 Tax=Caldicellulosiruptor naganoensis TaxID=29324 RepID=A0ABY7BHF8_9FIRM|nr:DNA internalization-related competence protein ComEC/Rec2 [Caldicellulosiruptor naganoensis]WAM32268.1 DNA internalization-related competence protein ComEC/Rec2 [Caldicellulosiruptor naganoensis]
MKRSALVLTVFLITGIVLGRNLSNLGLLFLIVSIASISFFALNFYFLSKKVDTILLLLAIVFFAFASIKTFYIFNIFEPDELLDGKEVVVLGKVSSFPEVDKEKISFYLKTKVNKRYVKIRVTTDSDKTLYYGQIVKVYGKLKIPKGKTNEFGFDYGEYLKGKGALYTLYAKKLYVVSKSNHILTYLNMFSSKLNCLISNSFDEEISALLKGLILGNKSTIPDDMYKDFQRSGLAHLLAVSGGNVGVLCAAIEIIFRRVLKVYGRGVNLIIIGVIVIFAIITGLSASVVRASIMATIYYLGRIIYRNPDTINSLSISALLMLLVNPLYLFDIGFQLSFLSVLSIALFYKMIYEYLVSLKIPKSISLLCAVSISAQVLILPLLAYYFCEVSLVSFLTNLIAVPLAGALVPIGLVYYMLLLFRIDLIVLKWVLLVIVKVLIWVSRLSHIRFSYIKIAFWDEKLVIAYYILILLLLYKKVIPKSIKLLMYSTISILVLIFILQIVINYNRLSISVIDVGQGDSSLITYKGFSMLIDTGPTNEDFSSLKRVVLPYILKSNVSKIDVLVLTHKHNDHIGDFDYLLNEIKVHVIVTSREVYSENLDKLRDKCVILVDKLKGLSYKDLKVFFFPPIEQDSNSSVLTKIVLGDFSMLFTGDASYESEKEYIKRYNLRATVLKVGHHGSSTATSDEFLESVKPKVAVISVGKNNMFGHPSDDVLQRLKKRGIKVFRTDLNGTVKIVKTKHRVLINPYMR